MSERPHGYARYRLDGCRCGPCGYARYLYDSRRKKLIAQGRWQPFVDPAPVREYVERLRAAGLGTRQVALLADLNRKAIQDMLAGRTRRIRPETAAALLAVPLDAPPRDKTPVDAIGVRRQVQALTAAGRSMTWQAAEFGWLLTNYQRLSIAEQVTAATARAVGELYDRWSLVPVEETPTAERIRVRARRRLWFTPGAWEPETIGDPEGLPCLLPPVEPVGRDLELLVQHLFAGHPVAATPAARIELVRRMPDRTTVEIARIARCVPQWVSSIRSELARREAA